MLGEGLGDLCERCWDHGDIMCHSFIPAAVIKYTDEHNFKGERVCMKLAIPVSSLLL